MLTMREFMYNNMPDYFNAEEVLFAYNYLTYFSDAAQTAVNKLYAPATAHIEACISCKIEIQNRIYDVWRLRHSIELQLANHEHSAFIARLVTETQLQKSVILNQLRQSLLSGDQILLDAGLDLIAGPIEPRKVDIAQHIMLLRAP
nr:URF2 [Talaromyces marneffei]